MPFKCVNCDTVVQKLDAAECECENPFFVKCEMVHYLHRDGVGEVYAKTYNTQGASIDDEGFSKPLTVRNLQELKLCCNAKKLNAKREVIHASVMQSIVSCPDCLAFIKSRSTKCQSSEGHTTDSTMDSQSETPKSDSENPTATMEETSTSML